jgi:ABC-type lipoprotein release transport system permease subunit
MKGRDENAARYFLVVGVLYDDPDVVPGSLLGAVASFALALFPIDVRSMAAVVDVPFFEIKSTPALVDFLVSAAAGIVCAVLAGTTPARRAARVDIVKALTTH